MSEYVIITFKKQNRNIIIPYLEQYFKTNELIFAHRFETNVSPEAIMFETNLDTFPSKIKEFADQKICNYVTIDRNHQSMVSKMLPKIFRMPEPLADSILQTFRQLIEELSESFHP